MTHTPRPAKWLRRAAILAWLAWLTSYALVAYQFFARVIHPHFLPLVSLLLVGCAAGIAAMGMGFWRIIRGPDRLAAMGWSLAAAIPVLLWSAHVTSSLSREGETNRPMLYRLRFDAVAAAALTDGLTRVVYPNRLEGEHSVMIYDECADPEAYVAAMDRHIEAVGKVLGRPLPTKVHWVRGRILGFRGISLVGTAICGVEPTGSPDRLSSLDRHETAHNVLHDQFPATASPPPVLYEGFAESQSGESMERRAWELFVQDGGRKNARSLRQWFSPVNYGYGGHEAYFQGGLLVDFLLRHYGGEKFYELCAICRPETIADDFQRIYGADLDQLDDLFWADVRQRAIGNRPKREKSISAELGLPDGPNDESARQEFLERYPKEVEKLKEAYRHVRMAAVAKWENLEPKPSDAQLPATEVKSESLRCGDRVRLIEHRAGDTAVYVAAPGRSFYLGKSGGAARFKTGWAGTGPDDWYVTTLAAVRRVAPELEAAYSIGPIDVLEWTRSPGFKITRAVRSQEGSKRLVRVYYECQRGGEDGRPYEAAGWLSFRPDDCWALDAFEERTRLPVPPQPPGKGKDAKRPDPDTFINQRTVRYRGKEQGVPVVESLEKTENRVGAFKYRESTRVTEIQFGAAPDETFDLASYDADPPAAPEEYIYVIITRWLVWAIWVCSAGVAISAAAPLVRRRASGERDTPVEP